MIPKPPKKSIPIPSASTPIPRPDAALTENEYEFILNDCLKPKHRNEPTVIAFIESFVRCRDIAQASEEAGIHKHLGYKYRHRNDINNAIQKISDRSVVKGGFDTSEILQKMKEVVDFDPIELENPDGTYKRYLHQIAPEARRCLKKLKVKNIIKNVEDMNGIKQPLWCGEIIEYEFYDKLKAGELAGKEKDMFKTTTKVQHDVTQDMKEVLLASSRRADKFIEDHSKIDSKPDILPVYRVKDDKDDTETQRN